MRGRWGERGPAWQAVDVPEPRVCRLHLGHVRAKCCCCCSRVPLAARGCKWQGEMWDGAELGPAASVYAPREGGRRAERLWCAESQPGAGVHREPDRGLGQPQALVLRLLPLSPVPAPSCAFRLVCTLLPTLIPSRSTLISPCSALQTWQSSDLPSSLPS